MLPSFSLPFIRSYSAVVNYLLALVSATKAGEQTPMSHITDRRIAVEELVPRERLGQMCQQQIKLRTDWPSVRIEEYVIESADSVNASMGSRAMLAIGINAPTTAVGTDSASA